MKRRLSLLFAIVAMLIPRLALATDPDDYLIRGGFVYEIEEKNGEQVAVMQPFSFGAQDEPKGDIKIPAYVYDGDGNKYPVKEFSNAHMIFHHCRDLTSVDMSESLIESIPSSTFAYTTNLKSIKFPSNLKYIGMYAFRESGLESVILPGSLRYMGDVSGLKQGCDLYAFADCPNLRVAYLEEGIEWLGQCFDGSALAELHLPASLTTIKRRHTFVSGWVDICPLNKCDALKAIYFAGTVPPQSGNVTDSPLFYDKLYDTCTLYVPAGCVDTYRNLGGGTSDYANFANIKETVNLYFELNTSRTEAILRKPDTNAGEIPYSGNIEVPATCIIEGQEYPVTEIGKQAFQNNTQVTSVVLPESIHTIDNQAFQWTSSLTSINIPEGVRSIGMHAFQYSVLENIELPSTLESIGSYAFSYNEKLKTIEIPAGVSSLNNTFRGCTALSAATLHKGSLTSMQSAFAECSSLQTVLVAEEQTPGVIDPDPLNTVPSTVTDLNYAFVKCAKMKRFAIPASVNTINGCFNGCTSLTDLQFSTGLTSLGLLSLATIGAEEIVIPDGVKELGDWVFSGSTGTFEGVNTNLQSLTIPASVTTSSYEALSGCTVLFNLTIESADTPIKINSTAANAAKYLSLPDALASYAIPVRNLYLGRPFVDQTGTDVTASIFANKNRIETVTFGTGLHTTPALTASTAIKSVTVEGYIVPVCGGFDSQVYSNATLYVAYGMGAKFRAANGWKNFSRIVEMDPPEPVIYYNYLDNNRAEVRATRSGEQLYLGNIILPETTEYNGQEYTVVGVGENAFSNTDIESVTLPETIEYISKWGFMNCYKLTTINLPESITSIGDWAFQACYLLDNISVPSIEGTLRGTFMACHALKNVTLGEGPTCLENTFDDCRSLESVVIPDGVSELKGTFNRCIALKQFTLPESIRIIHSQTFENTGLEEINLPEGVETIMDRALGNMNGTLNASSILKKAALPASLKTIDYTAFNNQTGLTELTILPAAEALVIGGSQASSFLDTPAESGVAPLETLSLGRDLTDVRGNNIVSGIFNRKTTLKSVEFGEAVTATPDLSLSEEIATVKVDGTVPPVCGGFAQSVYDNATLEIPAGSYDAYAKAEGWKNFSMFRVADDKVMLDIDFDALRLNDGSGSEPVAVYMRWNDGLGMDNLIMGVRVAPGASAEEILTAAMDINPRFTHSGSAYAYDLNGNGTLTKYDHNSADGTEGRWVITEAANSINRRVIILDYFAADGDYSFTEPDYLFYIPEDSETGLWLPDEWKAPIADEMVKIPVYAVIGNGGKITSFQSKYDDKSTVASINGSLVTGGNMNLYLSLSEAPTVSDLSVSVRGLINSSWSGYSNECLLHITAPEVPVESFRIAVDGTVAESHRIFTGNTVNLTVLPEPANATYTRVNWTNSNTQAAYLDINASPVTLLAISAGDLEISAGYAFDPEVTASVPLTLVKPSSGVTITLPEEIAANGLQLTIGDIAQANPVVTPASSYADVEVKVEDPSVASVYYVRAENTFEIISHKIGTTRITYRAAEDAEVTFTLTVADRDREAEIDYNAGIFWLNEDWYGHRNGSVNFLDDDLNVTYRAYERENPGQAFGCTSQFAIVHADKLVVMSKQNADGGDARNNGGGRVVIADARTLKRIASFDNIGGDGRACVGIGTDKFYLGHNQGVRVMRLVDGEYKLDEADIAGLSSASADLYDSQFGDMVYDGKYVYVAHQGVGVHVIDAKTDKFVSTIAQTDVQTVGLSADGGIWVITAEKAQRYSSANLDKTGEYTLPARLTVDWSTWRSANFSPARSHNTVFFGNAGNIYRWNLDGEMPQAPLFSLSQVATAGEQAYGSMRYDDATDQLFVAATKSGGTNYRNTYYYVVDATTGEINGQLELDKYYWFPAMPVVNDRYEPEFDEKLALWEIETADDDLVLNLADFVSDRDDYDGCIAYSLNDAGDTYGDVADVVLDGKTLTITPKAVGSMTLRLNAESRGHVASTDILVRVKKTDGISGVMAGKGISVIGNRIYFEGLDGYTFTLYDTAGVALMRFDCDSDSVAETPDCSTGVYVLSGQNAAGDRITTKIVLQ